MKNSLLFTLALFFVVNINCQEFEDGAWSWNHIISETLGADTEPASQFSVDPVSFQGELNEFSGGYQVGDTVANFKLWNSGNSFSLAENLESSIQENKYTILFTGSNSCTRFIEFWNGSNETYSEGRQFIQNHLNDFNWEMIYGIEAHPIDVINCASNCPMVIFAGPSGVGEFQHTQYQSRLEAIQRWTGIHNGSIQIPQQIYTYTPGETEPTGTAIQNYTTGFPQIPVWADNPDNAIYDTFFKRPFGAVVLDCKGVVIARADWLSFWLTDGEHGGGTGIDFLESLLETDMTDCEIWEDYCDDSSSDEDEDGYCDNWEVQNETELSDPCSPDNTDNDDDGLCNIQESLLGTDPDLSDTDSDGVSDYDEVQDGSDPLVDDQINSSVNEFYSNYKLYPNPTAGIVTIQSQSNLGSDVIIRSALGSEVRSYLAAGSSLKLNMESYSSGVYSVALIDSNGSRYLSKLIVE